MIGLLITLLYCFLRLTLGALIPDPAVEPVLSVERAGRICGLGRSASYAAAARGDLPTISFGRRRVVPTAALARLLSLDEPEPKAAVVIPFRGLKTGP